MKALVVAAHPDDETLGCGGLMARLAEAGAEVGTLIVGEGIASRGDLADKEVAALQKDLHGNARQAVLLLTGNSPKLLGYPDNRLDSVPLLDIVQEVEEVISELRPEVVLTHFGGDLNVDHQVVFRAVMTATRPMLNTCVRELYSFEIPSSTEWAFGKVSGLFKPNTFVDVTDFMDVKLDALACYDSEARPFPHPRAPKAVRDLAAARGAGVGRNAAEAFVRVWGRYTID